MRLGVADDRFTELVEGELKEGDEVIVRSRTEVRKYGPSAGTPVVSAGT